jgi:Uma2 family endonuclease
MSAPARFDVARHRFTVGEYERMGQVGVLDEDERVELLDGEIVRMTPIGPAHAGLVNRLNRMLMQRLGNRAIVTVQNPVRLAPYSEPQPDLAIARPRRDDYQLSHPDEREVLLIIEVADSSLPVDRGVKVPIYAVAGIPEVWLVDIPGRRVLVHRKPEDGAYTDTAEARPGDTLSLVDLGVTLQVSDLLGGV